jgi:hypothetical protein
MTRRPWTSSEDARVRREYPCTPTAVLAASLHRSVGGVYQRADKLGVKKSAAYLASPAAGRTTGRQVIGTRFPKGHVPANKGLRRPGWGPGRMKATQFKHGCRTGIAAKNWKPVGTILTDTDGYLRIKVREGDHRDKTYGFGNVRIWPLMQRHLWSQAHGPIPAGYTVVFKDGNRAHCTLDNLELVSRADLMRRNTVHRLPKELASTIQLIGALRRQIRKRDRLAQEQN